MAKSGVLAVFFCSMATSAAASLGAVLGPLDHFSKRLIGSRAIITGGLLVSRDLQYLASAGVKSVVSLFPFNATDSFKGVPGDFPSSETQQEMCADLGMESRVFDFGDNVLSVSSVTAVSDAINALPKPVSRQCSQNECLHIQLRFSFFFLYLSGVLALSRRLDGFVVRCASLSALGSP